MAHLILLERPEGLSGERIRELIREVIPRGVPISVRVARNHVEVGTPRPEIVDLIKSLGLREIRSECCCLKDLIEQERFWEAHELLEGAWRSSKDREGIELAIKLFAALVKVQEGSLTASMRIIDRVPPEIGKEMRSVIEKYALGMDVRDMILQMISMFPLDLSSFCDRRLVPGR